MRRDKLIEKIKALRSMTAERGCSEAEALAAAEKAAALMAEHSLSDDTLEIREKEMKVAISTKGVRAKIWAYIGHATNSATLHSGHRGNYKLIIVGREPGPEIACYLVDVCDRAIDRAVAEFKDGKIYKSRRATSTRRKAVEDFTVGMIERLGARLIAMFQPTISIDEYRKARDARDALFPVSRAVKMPERKTRFHEAADAGDRAGNKVHLARGVNDGNKPAGLIGGSR